MLNIYDTVPKDYHKFLLDNILSPNFEWNFWYKAIPDCLKLENRVDAEKFSNPTQLKHVFLSKYKESKYFYLIDPLIQFYKSASNRDILKVHAAAAIMQHPVKELTNITPHVDFDKPHLKNSELVTIIYYATKANGGTTLYNEFCSDSVTKDVTIWEYVPTQEGLMVEFNSNRFHSGVEPTDNIRIVITVIMEVAK